MVEVDNMRVMQILAEATNTIAEGEVLQLLNCHEPDTTELQYLEVILRKTAKLFEAASQLGAVLAGSDADTEQAMAAYGVHLGTAFQLIDDALDYSGDQATIGKQLGDDLAEGKPTLPLIHVMREGSPAEVETVRERRPKHDRRGHRGHCLHWGHRLHFAPRQGRGLAGPRRARRTPGFGVPRRAYRPGGLRGQPRLLIGV
jgi:octaprenyl-diphosphate synthase